LLIGSTRRAIIDSVTRLYKEPDTYRRMARVANPFGDGKASARIVKTFANHFAVETAELAFAA
jgi:UDP-N-acetylglucosamine 2-epimerase (non-hydrolysing)